MGSFHNVLPVLLLGALLAGCAVTTKEVPLSKSSELAPYDKVTTFLMFEGNAEEAMTLYTSVFDNARVERLERHGPDTIGAEGKILHAVLTIGGRPFILFDSPAPHSFTFTPSTSLFVMCETEEEFDRVYSALAEGGEVLMPPADYGFSSRYGWVNDRFGVSWQINLKAMSFGNGAVAR